MKPAIIVTGGTKGIGKAILEKFAPENFTLITCSRSEHNLAELKTEFSEKYPECNLYTWVADLSEKSEAQKFVKFIENLGLEIDILVNNVGLFIPGQIYNEAEGNFELMMQANVYSAYYLTKGILNHLIGRKKGHIFNICSIASIVPYIKGSSYSISKFALLGLSKVLREELKPYNIKVTAILPSATLTDSWNGTEEPPERFLKVEDIADVVYSCYQLSPQAVLEEIVIRPQLGDLL